KLMELLRQETDELHPMPTNEICRRLGTMGISCERRTLTKDIALLNELGFEVMWRKVGKEKGYYIEDRSFSVPELKILIDAVQAANFITEKKSTELIDKISALGGSHRADILKSNLVCFNTRKHSNEAIYYSVGYLEDAIQQKNKVLFRYFDLDENGEKVYRRDGHRYVVEPVALVFHEDNYYVVVYSEKHDSTANYRIDRMDSVEVLDEPVSQKASALRNEVAGYTERVFKMYGGQPVDIVIEFSDKLIGVLYDKVGENTKMIRTGENTCVATVKVQISPTFWGWLFQFGKQMRILSPAHLIDEYKNMISEAIE
ncbi:MAG: WYL domain-containing transcriptional regulator, partial [Eubacteriales bacterium]|nr:WYL domain-containing transcriptional regulator [Eubacteriales bacterium]